MPPIFVSHEEWISEDLPFALRIDRLNGHVQPHCHNYIEFNFTVQGEAVEKINGQEHPIKPGTFSMLFPHHIHEIIAERDKPVHMFVGSIRIESFFNKNGAFVALAELVSQAAFDKKPYYYLNEQVTSDITGILNSMLAEILGRQAWSTLMFKSKLAELLILFDRNRMEESGCNSTPKILSIKSGVWDVITYVSQNYQEDISLQSLSEKFHMSIPHISSSFHQLLGEKFHSYLEKIRIAQACDLLLSTSASILEVCYEAGFKSYKTFSRVFYNNLKISPTDYRKLEHRYLHKKNS